MHAKRLQSLLKKLEDPSPDIRRKAADELSEGDERAVYPLIKRLHDPSPGVQEAAMSSLIAIGGEATAYMVLPLLRESPAVRNMALLILKEICPVHLLGGLLRDRDDDIRKFAVDLIADIGDPAGIGFLKEVVNDPNPNVRSACYSAAGRLKAEELTDHLIRALDDQEWVAFSAVEALGNIASSRAVPALIGALRSARSETLRFALIDALGEIGDERARDVMLEWVSTRSGIEGDSALRSLLKIGIPRDAKELTERIIGLVKSPEREDLALGISGIRDLRQKEATLLLLDRGGSLDPTIPEDEELIYRIKDCLVSFGCTDELVQALKDENLRYRGKTLAIEVIAECRCREALPALLEVITSPVRDLRRAGVRAIGEIGEIDDPSPLLRSTSDPDGHVREAAAVALGRIGGDEVFLSLLEQLEIEPYSNVRGKIVDALIALDEPELRNRVSKLPPLLRETVASQCMEPETAVRLSSDPVPGVRAQAVLSLARFNTEEAKEALMKAVKDQSAEVRRAAVRTMGRLRCCKRELLGLLSDEDMWVRFHALQAVSELDGGDLADHLIRGLRDSSIPIVMKSLELLSEFPSEEARKAIEELSTHPDDSVRRKAEELLERR